MQPNITKESQNFQNKYEEVHSKYYTPETEEFHIKFIAYYNNEEFQINNEDQLHLLCTDIENVKVKYLDKEDIESLGFKQSMLQNYIFLKVVSNYEHYENITIGINYNIISKQLFVFFVPDEEAIPAGINIFIGKIKNKSELKKLLKQLNIEFDN